MLWHSYRRQDVSACFPEAFATHRCPFRSTVKALPETLPKPWAVVRGPRSKHLGPWSTDLEPRIMGLGSGLLGLIARSETNWFEGVGRMLGGACGLDTGRGVDGGRRSKGRLLRECLEAAASDRIWNSGKHASRAGIILWNYCRDILNPSNMAMRRALCFGRL